MGSSNEIPQKSNLDTPKAIKRIQSAHNANDNKDDKNPDDKTDDSKLDSQLVESQGESSLADMHLGD